MACRKDRFEPAYTAKAACIAQTDSPSGRTYGIDSVITYSCNESHCGILPLNTKNYWVYEDSVFSDGVFLKVQLDTLRYTNNIKSLEDGIVWWKGNLSVGLPDILYANDTAFFSMSDRMYNPDLKDVKRDYSLFTGDSIKYLSSFDDNAAQGRSLRLLEDVIIPAGNFNQCVYFEKNARNYRRDQIWFRPGVGVLKYIREKSPMGLRVIKLQQISTLVAYHIE